MKRWLVLYAVAFFAFLHLASVFFMKAYRPPRELTWITGALVFFLVLAFGFSGYLLPWNKVSYFATKVGTDMAAAVPLVGEHIARFLYVGELGHAVEIDDVIRRREPHVEHRHERLPAGEQSRVLESPEERNHLRHLLRVVIAEARRLHSGRMPAARITSRKRATSALMIAAICGAERGNMSMPAALMRCANSGVAITFAKSACSLATTSRGVPARAMRP